MNIEEIIRYVATEVLKARPIQAELFSTGRGLTTTDNIMRLLDDAQDELALESGCLIDQDTPDLAVYALVDGQQFVDLNPLVSSLYDDPVIVLADGNFRKLHRTRPRVLHTHNGTIPQCFQLQSGVNDRKRLHLIPSVGENNLSVKAIVQHRAVVRFMGPAGESSTVRNARLKMQCEIPTLYHERLGDYVLMRTTTPRDVDKNAARESLAAQERWYDTKLALKSDTYRLHSADDTAFVNPQR